MSKKTKLPILPPGWTVRKNNLIGVDFVDENGNIACQDAADSVGTRKIAWQVYLGRIFRDADR